MAFAVPPRMNKTFYVKYVGIVDGNMGVLTRKESVTPHYSRLKQCRMLNRRNTETFGKPKTPKACTKHPRKKVMAIPLAKPAISFESLGSTQNCPKTDQSRSRNLFKSRRSTTSNTKRISKANGTAETMKKGMEFLFKRPTLFNILMSPIMLTNYSLNNASEPATSTNTAPAKNVTSPISAQRILTTSCNLPEKLTGIPKPEKYSERIITNSMPIKRLLFARRSADFKRAKNFNSLLEVQCPAQRTGVTGTKIIQKQARPQTRERTSINLPSETISKRPKKLRSWELYQKKVLLKARRTKQLNNTTVGSSMFTNKVCRKSLCLSLNTEEGKNRAASADASFGKRKRRIIALALKSSARASHSVLFE